MTDDGDTSMTIDASGSSRSRSRWVSRFRQTIRHDLGVITSLFPSTKSDIATMLATSFATKSFLRKAVGTGAKVAGRAFSAHTSVFTPNVVCSFDKGIWSSYHDGIPGSHTTFLPFQNRFRISVKLSSRNSTRHSKAPSLLIHHNEQLSSRGIRTR